MRVFDLIFRASKEMLVESVATALKNYISEHNPVITRDESGAINAGFIDFDSSDHKVLMLQNLEEFADKIFSELSANPTSAIGVNFEPQTGSVLLVRVPEEHVDVLNTALACWGAEE